ncbi:SDR family oxidoreductase [Candidatus Micrarchaeota archaeon]|nr:SDR family oxidoreductase [Candidatus Micrarchaeota archaeon]
MKIAIVTGGSGGIGESISRALAKKYKVCISFNKSKEKALKLAKELKGIAVECDVSSEASVKKLFNEAEKHGEIAVLVNNAGAIHWVSSYKEVSSEMFDELMQTNAKGCFLTSKEFGLRVKKGVIVNIASTGALNNSFPGVHYNASKAAVLSLTQSFANLLAPIRVNAVSPGIIASNDNAEKFYGTRFQEIISKIPLKRLGKPEEIANAVLFCVENEYLTGQNIIVAGGRVMR